MSQYAQRGISVVDEEPEDERSCPLSGESAGVYRCA